MPYTYTLAREARDLGLPLMRALWLHYPDDERARGIGDQYLWGRDLMIAPVYTAGASSRDVYLPRGRLVRLVDRRPRHRRSVDRESRRPRDDADLRPRRRHHPCRSGPPVHRTRS